MKKGVFVVLSFILSFCFIFSGCNLFIEDDMNKSNQIAVEAGSITITREELIRGYNNYYQTFYNNSGQDSQKAMDSLIDYLISKKLFIRDAEELIQEEKINITETEYNYIWYSVYLALINNLETFENEVKKELNIEEDEEDEEEFDKEEQFVYTPYTKNAKIVKNEETGDYEIKLINYVLKEEIYEETGERKYEYVPEEEIIEFDGEVLDIEKVIEMVNENKLLKGKTELSTEEEMSKSISKEALRRYIYQLRKNEEGKGLSTEDESVYEREIERVYNIVYENLLINKLYEYKTSGIEISEEDVLNRYLWKVKESYERYLWDSEKYITEVMTTVGSANSGYNTKTNSIEDVYYIPKKDVINETFFYITHIIIQLSDSQVQEINDLKQKYENNDDMTEEDYNIEYNKIVDKSEMKLSERDKEGNIIIKDTDEDAITLEEMLQNLTDDMDDIDAKYKVTIKGDLAELSTEDYFSYIHERADKFNEYIYKYSKDGGTLQIQKNIFGQTNENWYIYAMGDGAMDRKETDLGFVESFVDKARELFNDGKGQLSSYDTILMENWQENEDGIDILLTGSTGYSIMFYGGTVENLFECFDLEVFNLDDLPSDALFTMDNKRLGLTMNKTLFDLIYEQVYDEIYNEIIKEYEDSIIKNSNIIKYENIYKDLLVG